MFLNQIKLIRKWQITQHYLGLVLSVLMLSCSDVRLVKAPSPLPNAFGKGELCITEPDEVKRWMKFLFVMDKSGSNDSTDNGALKRAGNIKKFLDANTSTTNNQYGMIVFQGEEARAFIEEGNDQSPTFTPDLAKAMAANERLKSESDGGATPYKAALQLARSAIQNDIQKYPDEESFYMIFFVSDGEPTDVGNDNELDDLVKGIIQLDSKNIALSTGFYGGNGRSAEERLARMAKVGNGKFINFETSSNWDFNELIVKPTYEPYQLKNEVVIYNLNAGFCEDGSIDLDSDADGMCDKDERRYVGFDPARRFSFGDGFGDYFHWREVKYRESLPKCMDRSDEDHDFLTTCEEAYIRNENPPANIPKNGDPKDPDTDHDGIIDGIETFVYMTRTMAYAMDAFNLQENFDGEEPSRRQILQHRSPLIRDASQPAYDIQITPILGRNLDCYDYKQSVLPLYNTLAVREDDALPGMSHKQGENVISVHYIQTHQSDPRGDGIYRFSLQKLYNDEATRRLIGTNQALKFDDKIFRSYKFGKRRKK